MLSPMYPKLYNHKGTSKLIKPTKHHELFCLNSKLLYFQEGEQVVPWTILSNRCTLQVGKIVIYRICSIYDMVRIALLNFYTISAHLS